MPDEVAGTPLLAVLSTVVLDADDSRCVSAVLTVGLLDDGDETVGVEPEWLALDALDALDNHDDHRGGSVRYVLPTPDRQLALLAEFTVTGSVDIEIYRRIEALMASFRWAA